MRLPNSEPELVSLAAQCSSEAFSALTDRHQPLLRLIARRYGQTRADQEDLVQDVIARLLEREKQALKDWKPLAPFAAYLTTIASRRGIRVQEQQGRLPSHAPKALGEGRAPAHMEMDFIAETIPAPAKDRPHEQLESSERTTAIHEALKQLSDHDQLLIRLRYFEELDGLQIAQMLAISHAAARQGVFRALRRLERVLDGRAEAVFPDL